MAAGGGNAERVTFTGSYNISPAHQPRRPHAGLRIAHRRSVQGCTTLDLGGGASRSAITDTSDDESPSFAPNGRLIIYATRAQGRDVLMTTTLDGKIKARLLSPDGRCARAGLGPVRPSERRPNTPQGEDHHEPSSNLAVSRR